MKIGGQLPWKGSVLMGGGGDNGGIVSAGHRRREKRASRVSMSAQNSTSSVRKAVRQNLRSSLFAHHRHFHQWPLLLVQGWLFPFPTGWWGWWGAPTKSGHGMSFKCKEDAVNWFLWCVWRRGGAPWLPGWYSWPLFLFCLGFYFWVFANSVSWKSGEGGGCTAEWFAELALASICFIWSNHTSFSNSLLPCLTHWR